MNPGELVKGWLKDKDMRREELACRMKVSVVTLNRFFAGKPVRYPTVMALSHVTGIPEAALANRSRTTAKAARRAS